MMVSTANDSRIRAYLQFLVAIFYYFLARALARHAALGLANDQWSPLVQQAVLVFLLLLGLAGLGFSLNRQAQPVSAQGLPRRAGWPREAGLGLALGWAVALLCVAAMALDGGIAVSVSTRLSNWGWLLADVAYFLLLALAEELAFRGYAFQRFARSAGWGGAVLGFALLYAFLQTLQPGWNRASVAVSLVFSLLLSTAYLRTRALWVSWGLNFGWKASRALVFGLTVSGVTSHSPLVQGDPMGPFWLTGGGFGLDGSWFAFVALLAAIPILYRATHDLDYQYNAPQFVPGGIPVDLDAAARRQHETAMGAAEPAPPPLVQIAPAPPVQSALTAESPSSEAGNESQ